MQTGTLVEQNPQKHGNVRLARDFNPLNDRAMNELWAKTEEIRRQALFFRRWEA